MLPPAIPRLRAVAYLAFRIRIRVCGLESGFLQAESNRPLAGDLKKLSAGRAFVPARPPDVDTARAASVHACEAPIFRFYFFEKLFHREKPKSAKNERPRKPWAFTACFVSSRTCGDIA